jgi:hypothetical protein
MSMIAVASEDCPNCFTPHVLGATVCQACGYSLIPAPPTIEAPNPKPRSGARVWCVIASCYWILEFVVGILWLDSKSRQEYEENLVGEFAACVVVGALILIAVGVIQEWRWARSVALVLGWIGLVFGLGEIAFVVTGAFSGNQDALAQIGVSALETAMSYLMIWSIRATEVS